MSLTTSDASTRTTRYPALERPITGAVSAPAFAVIRAVDLRHEALRGSQEICDEAPEQWHLPAKEHAQTAPTNALPEKLLG